MKIEDDCFACREEAARYRDQTRFIDVEEDCVEYCPIKWAGGEGCGDGSEFDSWTRAKTIKERKYWAKKIANKRWSKP